MASRKRPAAPDVRDERHDATNAGSSATRRRRVSSGDTPVQTPSPRLASVTALSIRRETPRTAQATQTKPTTATRDAAHNSSPRNSETRLSVRQCFGELRTALSEGWEIVQPIFARPLWSAADNSTTAFSFVLRREQATRLVTVPEGRTVQRFIRDRELTVDYRR
jgi:hypothetical protein